MIVSARRVSSPFTKQARGNNPAARLGLAYERKLAKAFKTFGAYEVEHGLFFEYTEILVGYEWTSRRRLCSPDFILHGSNHVVVVECKLKYTSVALDKLRDIYCRVVGYATHSICRPLVICKYLAPGVKSHLYLGDAICSTDSPVFQWNGREKLRL